MVPNTSYLVTILRLTTLSIRLCIKTIDDLVEVLPTLASFFKVGDLFCGRDVDCDIALMPNITFLSVNLTGAGESCPQVLQKNLHSLLLRRVSAEFVP